MPIDEFWESARKELEKNLIDVAFDLMAFTSTASVAVPVPNTSPVVYVAVGEAGKIKSLMDDLASE
jgi:hypothetical protein